MDIGTIYQKFHFLTADKSERGEYSSGRWQKLVRDEALLLCPASGSILEVGCGEGLFLQALVSSNPHQRVTGVEIDFNRAASAHRRLAGKTGLPPAMVAHADGSRLPFADELFDAVVCVNVLFNLHSFKQVTAVVGEMARVCKKGGVILFDFRNRANVLLYLKYHFARWYDPTVKNLPLVTYHLRQIQRMLRQFPLETKEIKYCGFFGTCAAPLVIMELKKC